MSSNYTGRRIAVEEGYRTPEFAAFAREYIDPDGSEPRWIGDAHRQIYLPEEVAARAPMIADLGPGRIAQMDAAGLDVQLLVQAFPGTQVLPPDRAVEFTQRMNSDLAKAVAAYPQRLAGLASLPTQHPEQAAEELRRAVTDLGLKGAVVHSYSRGPEWPERGVHMDDPSMWPVFEEAQRLGVPLYLHPTIPSPQMSEPYRDYGLGGPIWGYSAEASVHVLRIIFSGALDRFPGLRIVLGHLGEGIPYYFERLDEWYAVSDKKVVLEKKPSDYFRENIYVATSGMNRAASLVFCHSVLGAERIMFAADYPQEPLREEIAAMDAAPFSDADKHAIYHENAEKVFGL
jgi:5-carboxyvanillate decarboxylase